MGRLIKIQDLDQFHEVVNIPEAAITSDVLSNVRNWMNDETLSPCSVRFSGIQRKTHTVLLK